jgi:hypothetical protein
MEAAKAWIGLQSQRKNIYNSLTVSVAHTKSPFHSRTPATNSFLHSRTFSSQVIVAPSFLSLPCTAQMNCRLSSPSLTESDITTDGQSATLSWNKVPMWGLRPDFYYCQTVAGLLVWGAVCDEMKWCRLQLLLALASAVIPGFESHGTRDHILLSQNWDFPFCRLLRLAGLRWRYSTPPPHNLTGPIVFLINTFHGPNIKQFPTITVFL